MRIEVMKIREQLENLVQKETILAQEIAPYRMILHSPFRSLPDDVLEVIFLACLPNDHIPVIDFRQPPLLLTQISSHLRRVAFGTPRLWTAIDVPILAPCLTQWFDGRDDSRICYAKRTMAKYAWAVDQWLRRTGACDIEIFIHEKGNHIASCYVEEIFQLLIKRVPQWKSISFHCSAYSIQHFCYMLGQSSFKEFQEFKFPRLKHLSLDISGEYLQQDDPQQEYNYISHLPDAFRLNSIHLVVPADNYEGYCIHWSRITYLSLGNASYPSSLNSIVKILELCSGLLSCKLYIKMDNTIIRLCLPHLRDISIAFDQEAWFGDSKIYGNAFYTLQMKKAFSIFDRLGLPTLKRITYDASTEFMPLLGLIHRMDNRITHLSVTNFEVPTELMECLKACPLLVALDVSLHRPLPLCYGPLLETNFFAI
ncbi:hypothetical protein HYPSUDRAFT_201786 [Hypholoma sublateritium FD-334 SS-4]|uniref:F-box domain-containing protein n=1 Tax=Hypholoma sublateritium (strain FD-334 SS-4) TaxID=945553 RepID=A0A0D2MH69_HYPSF|nr:hypothetical protein HYPSUDRAFT_201786 [Hypholoma sublateritium FD-334 SS-4]